ncbi:MAG TPA: rod-binding protein [Candidatus Acidoferrum sp.]|nr:rod-binding protein [Candidatus Acidoferrum sp.]
MTSVANLAATAPASASLAGLSRQSASDGASTVYNDLGSLTRLQAQSHSDPKAVLHQVSQQFESLFVTMMVKAMRDTIPKDGMFGGTDMESYQQMSDQQMSLNLSRNGSIGLAKVIERQLSHTIEPRGQ